MSKMLHKSLIFIALSLFTLQLMSQSIPEDLEISLLTCSSGEEIYAAFGHSAIRVKDMNRHQDIVFDFGVFDFDEPNFVLKFVRGNLKYRLAISDFDDFMAMYREQGREVMEERLNLTGTEKQSVLSMLMYNYLPENRYYYYDFLFDNCSTRIRDLVDTLHSYYVPLDYKDAPSYSFRDNLEQYLHRLPWMKFGIDVVLGSRLDRTMTFREQMFLPVNLSKNFRQYRRISDNTELLATPRVLTEKINVEIIPGKGIFTPFNTLIFIFIIIVVVTLMKPELTKPIGYTIFILIGLQGLVLLILWTGTSHYATKANWNILWVNPLYLFIILGNPKVMKSILFFILIFSDIFILISWNFLPQEFNTAALPLIGILIYLKIKILFRSPRRLRLFQSRS